MNRIQLSALSQYRSQLMGFAILIVILFHVGGMRHDTIAYCFCRCGNVGVDIFLFVSGIGIWHSWCKRPDLWTYLVRRCVRIYPAWTVIACFYYIPLYYKGQLSGTYTIVEILFNWGFWEHDELNFWYIPAIMMLYVIAPAYMHLIQRSPSYRWMPVMAILICLLLNYWSPFHHALGHLEIFFSRIPIFLIGVNMGTWVKEGRSLERQSYGMLLMILGASILACVNFENGLRYHFPLFLERMTYIPLTVTLSVLLCQTFRHFPRWMNDALGFLGSISLELYLIHIGFIVRLIRPYHWSFWPTAIAVTVISTLLAWMLHMAIGQASTLLSASRSHIREKKQEERKHEH